jgi:hypothetical protein
MRQEGQEERAHETARTVFQTGSRGSRRSNDSTSTNTGRVPRKSTLAGDASLEPDARFGRRLRHLEGKLARGPQHLGGPFMRVTREGHAVVLEDRPLSGRRGKARLDQTLPQGGGRLLLKPT